MGVNRAGPPSRELRRDFGLEAGSFTRWPVGFESECWIVDDRWFVKVWHDRDHPADLAVPTALADAGLRSLGRCAQS